MSNPIQSEPVMTAYGLTQVLSLVFPVLVAFKVPVTAAQQTAVLALVGAFIMWWARSRVSPVKTPPADSKPIAPSSPIAPAGGQDVTDATLPRIRKAFVPAWMALCVGIALLFVPGAFGCSSAQTPQAQAAQARQYGRLAYSAGVLGVKTLEDVRIAWMKGTGEAPTAAQVKIAEDVSTGLHAAHDALEKVRPWVEGGSGGSPEKERLLEALDSVALVAELLVGAGAKVPPDVMQGIAAARALLGGA